MFRFVWWRLQVHNLYPPVPVGHIASILLCQLDCSCRLPLYSIPHDYRVICDSDQIQNFHALHVECGLLQSMSWWRFPEIRTWSSVGLLCKNVMKYMYRLSEHLNQRTGSCGDGMFTWGSCGDDVDGSGWHVEVVKSLSMPGISIFPKFSNSVIIFVQSVFPLPVAIESVVWWTSAEITIAYKVSRATQQDSRFTSYYYTVSLLPCCWGCEDGDVWLSHESNALSLLCPEYWSGAYNQSMNHVICFQMLLVQLMGWRSRE